MNNNTQNDEYEYGNYSNTKSNKNESLRNSSTKLNPKPRQDSNLINLNNPNK